jgi:hypothetical protein
MELSPPLWMRVVCNVARGFLAVLSLAVAFVAGAVVIVPLAIFVPPLVAILGGLLVLVVLGATESMADNWHAARLRRRPVGAPVPSPRTPAAAVREPLPGARAGR